MFEILFPLQLLFPFLVSTTENAKMKASELSFSMPLFPYFVFCERNSVPAETSQTLTASPLTLVSERPSLLKATAATGSSCPRKNLQLLPV